MAILNEIPIMSEFNIWMLIGGLIAIVIGAIILLPVLRFDDISGTRIFICLTLGIMLVGAGLTSIVLHKDPDFQLVTNKKYIEATFVNGEIPAAYLKKYNVIDQRDNLYVLEEK